MRIILLVAHLLLFGLSLAQTPQPNLQDIYIQSIPAWNGIPSSGAYSVWFGPQNSNTIDKPLIIVEGWDPYNDIDPTYIYSKMNYQLNNLRQDGYDVIILNFNNSENYLQANAYLVSSLIQEINSIKTSNVDNVIIGISMGGLVSRYALTKMEQDGINHEVRTFISLDAPQQGAYVPLSLQQWINYQTTYTGSYFNPMYTMLHSFAAKQMLIYNGQNGNPGNPTCSVLHDSFFNELKSLNSCNGYPIGCTRIGLSNGSLSGESQINNYNVETNAGICNLGYQCPETGLTFESGLLYLLPDATNQTENLFCVSGLLQNSCVYINSTNCKSYDVCPGGYFPFFEETAQTLESISCATNIIADHTCFVPTISALDITSNDLFYNIESDNDILQKTPFNVIHGESINSQHDDISWNTAQWICSIIDMPSIYCFRDNLNIATPIEGRYSEKAFHIECSSHVSNIANASLSAANEIKLLPGFHAVRGSSFKATTNYYEHNKCLNPLLKSESRDFNESNLASFQKLSPSLIISPNPAKQNLYISGDFDESTTFELYIYNSMGQVVLVSKKLERTIDISAFENGVYLLKFTCNENHFVQKLIIEH